MGLRFKHPPNGADRLTVQRPSTQTRVVVCIQSIAMKQNRWGGGCERWTMERLFWFLLMMTWVCVGTATEPKSEKVPPAGKVTTSNHGTSGHGGTSLNAEEALAALKSGQERYVAGTLKHPNISAARRAETAAQGQTPLATVLGCSDSRMPLEFIFDQGIGDLFVIRVAGNVADTIEIGTMEYGVGHLGTPVLIVLGHSKCGAVTAAVKGGELHGLIPALVDNIKPAAAKAKAAGGTEADQITEAIKANVFQSIADILKRSKLIRDKFTAGKLQIVGGVYDLEDGHVTWLGAHEAQAKPH